MNALHKKIDFNLVVILTLPFILVAANSEWLFPYGNPSDAWMNKTYFFETGNDYPALYSSYKAARASLHLKGLLAHYFFSPLIAHYVLHLSIFCAFLAAFYLTISNLLNKHIAFISTVAFGTYSQYHAIVSFEWDYELHDSGINTLLTLLFLLLAAKGTRWRVWLVLAGATWASEVQSTYPALFIPVITFWYLYLNHKHQRHPIIASAIYIIIGAVAATLLYGIATYLLGGSLFIFEPLIPTMLAFGLGGYNFHPGYWFPLGTQLQHTKGISFPLFGTAITGIVLAAILIQRLKLPSIDAIKLCLITLLATFACSLALHLIGHGQLSNDHMIAFMTPYVFIGFAGVYAYFLRNADITAPSNAYKAIILKGIVFVIFCGTLIYGLTVQSAALSALRIIALYAITPWITGIILILLLFFSVVAGILGILLARFRFWKAGVITLCLSGFLSLANAQSTSIGLESYDVSYKCLVRKDQYRAVIEAYLKIASFDAKRDMRLWYRANENPLNPRSQCLDRDKFIPQSATYGAVLGMMGKGHIPRPFLIDSYLATTSFAFLARERPSTFPPVFRAAVLAQDPKDHETALNTMRSHGLKPKILDRSHVEHGVISFGITIVEIRKDARLKAESRL